MFVITNGKNFMAQDSTNRHEVVNSVTLAAKYEERKKAENFLANLPRSFKNIGYYVQEIAIEEKSETVSDEKEIVGEFSSFVNEAKKTIEDFSEFINNLNAKKKELERQKEEADKEIFDLVHAIELREELNCPKAYKLYNMIRDARIKRREAKDGIEVIDIITEEGLVGIKSGRCMRRINGMDNRKYTPRILKELFD